MTEKTTAIVWFRTDLRLADNPALHTAVQDADQIVPVYILDEMAGGAARWWLHHSLTALGADLRERGAELVLRRGEPAEIIPALAKKLKAASVHAAQSFEPAMRDGDKAVGAALEKDGVAFTQHLSISLFPPDEIKTKGGGLFNVYSPFARACFERGVPDAMVPAPKKIPGQPKVTGDKLDSWKLLPTKPDWAGGLRETWTPGEAGALKRLHAFMDGAIDGYDKARDLPGQPGTSMLSPHTHHGEISPRLLWHEAAKRGKSKGVQTFLKELLWREFSISLLWQHPKLDSQPIREEFANFPWANDKQALHAWQRGQTGVPIVDAGMRQLWQTGWMHNRVRMITASFLIKHLLIPWQEGEAWFWDTLAEADLAANSASWQWVAGCGADAAPYFRIFNPVLQGFKFDTAGDYVRKYVPEIAALPDKFIHCPWDADEETLATANVHLGKTYPHAVIALAEGRDRALKAYQRIKGG